MRSELVEHCHRAHGCVARQGSDHAVKWPLRFRAILSVALVSLACLTTDGGLLSEARRGAFAQAAPAGPRLVDDNGTPVGGWWALAPGPQQGRIAVLARWMPTPAMHTARSEHTATLLPSGQVLVAGGAFNPSANAELYNPVTGQWTLTGALNTPRFGHTATLLPSGQVLVAGGVDATFNPSANAELYNPVTGQWTLTGALNMARMFHTAALLPSGQVLVAGGGGQHYSPGFMDFVGTAELYDPATGQWTLTGALNMWRMFHTAALLPSGQVLVAGGGAPAGFLDPDQWPYSLASAELYDPATGRWTLTGALNMARFGHTATLLRSGQVLVAGGTDLAPGQGYLYPTAAELYDPATGQWTPTGALHTARFAHTATLFPSGQVLVAGGLGSDPSQSVLASTEAYNPVTGQWTPTAVALNTPRDNHTATLLPSGRVLVAGGFTASVEITASAEIPETFRSVVADSPSTQIDDTALFDFTDLRRPLVRAAGGLPLDLAKVDQSGDWTAVVDEPARPGTFFQDTAPLVVTDLGRYQVQLGVRRQDSSLASFFLQTALSSPTVMAHYDQPPPDPAPPVQLTVLFRFFPDGTPVGALLQQGEVAIFQKCNYQGNAAVFIADAPNLAALTSSDVTLGAASVRLGNNTGIVLYTGNGYTGTSQVVETDTPCLDATLDATPLGSFQIEPLVPDLVRSSKKCEHCQLVGVDLSGVDLSGVDLQGAILDNATGLAGQLSGGLFNNASLKNVDLSNALLYGANFTNANLENASLSGAFLTNNLNVNPPIPAPANFTGAHLKNVNLSGAKLDGVIFDHASFYGSFNGVAPNPPCQTDTTQCSSAAKTGFTCSCATAVGATMVRTDFSNAYLYGVDFGRSTTIVNGVNFTGAVLVGANFTGATFAVDPTQGGAPPDFSSAYLQGVQFDPTANLTNTSLSGAFVDFGATKIKGNSMQLLLGPAYTAFRGWEAPNQSVCVQAAYESFTVVPTTIPTMTCPDSNTYAAGCGATQASNLQWASQTPIDQASPPGWYQFDATYTQADQRNACNGNTFNLDW